MSSKSPRRWKTDAERPAKHPLLDGARGHFDEVRQGNPKVYVVPRKRNLVDIFVTSGTLDRALKVASELFLFLEDRGQRVVLAPAARRYHRAKVEVREGVKPNQHDYDYDRGRWEPAVPTVVLVEDVVVGVTIFETMEEADGVYSDGGHVRYEPPKDPPKVKRGRFAIPERQPYVSKHWFPTGRLGIHAYAAEHVSWEQTWLEKLPGDATTFFDDIAKSLERARPRITKLLEEKAREAEKHRKEFEAQQIRWRREEEERRRKEEEVARVKRVQEDVASWRLARDIRAFVAEAQQMVADAHCAITKGGSLDKSHSWLLEYAEKVDPLAGLRADLQKAVREQEAANRPAPACEPATGAGTADEASPTPPHGAAQSSRCSD